MWRTGRKACWSCSTRSGDTLENPNPNCPVGGNIHHILDSRLLQVQEAMESALRLIPLEDVKSDMAKYL